MKRAQPLKVERVEHYRYRVTSETGAGSYLVDLLENDGSGACDCADFQTRRGPLLNQGKRGEATRCKHIRAARWNFFCDIADDLFARLAKKEQYEGP